MTLQTQQQRIWVYWLTLALAILTYFFGLDSLHIFKNGDEYVYAHILRETAASQNLLPLQSELDGMRNTKPPMIYWQGIVSTNWAQDWEHWRLRWPSILYTFLTGLLIFLLLRKKAGLEQAFTGLLLFLAFMTSYRYGRPYLTDSPMVFWLSLPAFVLLLNRPALFNSKLLFPVFVGFALGIGFLYKSFMLLIPTCLTFAVWYWRERDYRISTFLIYDAYKLILMSLISLGLFSIWFVFDPDPQAIVQEFVFQENVGKIKQNNSYLATLLWGQDGSSMWKLIIGLPFNTGLLFIPSVVMFYLAYTNRREQGATERMLWIWIAIYLVIFCLPTQRSARYLMPIMPALAVLLSLYWQRIPVWALRFSLFISILLIFVFTGLIVKLQSYFNGVASYPLTAWVIIFTALALNIFTLLKRHWIYQLTPASLLTVYLVLSSMFYPFDEEQGHYSVAVRARVANKAVGVPYNFRAKYERYGFLLPGADIIGYKSNDPFSFESLKQEFEYFAYQHPAGLVSEYGKCEVLGSRLDVRSRQSAKEGREILLENRMDHLFVIEDLLYCPE